MKTERIIVSELIIDYDIYPRASIDSNHVTDLADAELAGAVLPPPVIDLKTKRIADGVHRIKKHIRLYGDDSEIDVIFKEYNNDKELYLDALRLNSDLKKKISGSDRTHAIIRGIDLGIKDTAIAEAFGVTVEKVQKIVQIKTGKVKTFSAKNKKAKSRTIQLKNSVRHHWGKDKEYTTEQANWITKHAPGQQQVTMIKQLADLIELDLLDKDNQRVIFELVRLRNLLTEIAEVSA